MADAKIREGNPHSPPLPLHTVHRSLNSSPFLFFEGMEFMTAAEKARNKKTLFGKEKPDWDMAVQGYEAAGELWGWGDG